MMTNLNANYPPMSLHEWNSAPFNQTDPIEKEFDVTCSQSLSKTVSVLTDNYIPGVPEIEYERDDEGRWEAIGHEGDPDTSDTNWADEYHDNDYHTPIQLIGILKEVLQKDIANGIVFKSPKFTEHLIEECDGWQEDETEYFRE